MDFVKPKLKSISTSQLNVESNEPPPQCIDSGTDISKNKKTQSSLPLFPTLKHTQPPDTSAHKTYDPQVTLESARREIAREWLRTPPRGGSRPRSGNEVWGPEVPLVFMNSLAAIPEDLHQPTLETLERRRKSGRDKDKNGVLKANGEVWMFPTPAFQHRPRQSLKGYISQWLRNGLKKKRP